MCSISSTAIIILQVIHYSEESLIYTTHPHIVVAQRKRWETMVWTWKWYLVNFNIAAPLPVCALCSTCPWWGEGVTNRVKSYKECRLQHDRRDWTNGRQVYVAATTGHERKAATLPVATAATTLSCAGNDHHFRAERRRDWSNDEADNEFCREEQRMRGEWKWDSKPW